MNKLNICLQLLNYSILDYVRRLYRTADHRNGRTTRLCDVTDKIVLVHLVTVEMYFHECTGLQARQSLAQSWIRHRKQWSHYPFYFFAVGQIFLFQKRNFSHFFAKKKEKWKKTVGLFCLQKNKITTLFCKKMMFTKMPVLQKKIFYNKIVL